MLRTDAPHKLHELAEYATVPVINGLTETSHPCQLMADVLTFEEHRGPIAGQVVAWCGDGNNVARSWIQAAARFGFTLRLATPDAAAPAAPTLLAWARAAGRRDRGDRRSRRRRWRARAASSPIPGCRMPDDPNESRHNCSRPTR